MSETKIKRKLAATRCPREGPEAILKAAPKRQFPTDLRPMVVTLVNEERIRRRYRRRSRTTNLG